MDSQLRQISQLVQEKRFADARAPLQKYLRANPDSAYAWYLLSFVVATPAEKQKAIRKAVQLAPDDPKYTARLTKLGAAKKRSPVLPLVILGVVLIAIVAVAFVALRPAATPAAESSATTVAQNSTTTGDSSQIAAVASATVESSILSTDETVTPAQEDAEATDDSTNLPTAASEEISTTAAQSLNQTVDVNELPLLAAPTQQSAAPLPTALSSIDGTAAPTQQPQPTEATRSAPEVPTSTPGTIITTALPSVPTVTPGGEAGVALSTPLDIGSGDMRIVAAVRPATTLINDLGGAAANPPAGQEWLLVEALVICSGSDNCAPALSNIRVIGSSGTVYAPAPDFSMPQLFGPGAFAVGQVWGYMGFTVPTSETTLRLALNQGGQTYIFALQ
jgi:hypothetical protein